MRAQTYLLVSVFMVAQAVYAQQPWTDLLRPSWSRNAELVRNYVRSSQFLQIEHDQSDVQAIDSIFAFALRAADFNIPLALLSTAMGCFDHKTIYFKIIFTTIPIPLSFEGDSEFHERYSHLPSHIFTDSPPEGDRDKLQHFFGSAFIEWTADSHTFANTVGDAIELLEPPLIVGGDNDPRDKRANRAGIAFAQLLHKYPALPPSTVLNLVR